MFYSSVLTCHAINDYVYNIGKVWIQVKRDLVHGDGHFVRLCKEGRLLKITVTRGRGHSSYRYLTHPGPRYSNHPVACQNREFEAEIWCVYVFEIDIQAISGI